MPTILQLYGGAYTGGRENPDKINPVKDRQPKRCHTLTVDAYSSMAPDRSSDIFRGPYAPIL